MLNANDHDVIIFDGACGTNLQAMEIPASAWEDKEGCNEFLNVSAPDVIVQLHASFIDAGAMVLETNTFGASRTVLAEYGLENEVARINRAAVENARKAIGDRANRYLCGSVGPGTKLPSLGHIGYDDLFTAYTEQFRALAEAGVDAFIIETCQDMMQVKIALTSCFETQEALGVDIPVMVSVTIERTGTMLVGSDISAAAVTVEPFPIMSFGLNCATGPSDMISRIQYLSHNWPGRISCIPNQGMPEVVDGETRYPMAPREYADHMKHFVEAFGVSVVGGCCGTTPEHIRVLVETLASVTPGEREIVT
ncbi:MAG: homocysteine S-methyltransferase family protein [Kiritimatiellia bacterium]|jgi:5-methyltetrahydrofolate--homocysteine methyltransferase|nr:homocysteine S-methyltransferase family protein [Kiritimatiellia bacterium]MDP6847288.1 homocysteine S-methyltransferase family protein [Kiritimatiellia bacterium]